MSSLLCFIDESGDHNLDYSKVNDPYEVFVLSAVCFQESDYLIFDQKFRELKTHFFGDDSFIVHTKEMTRPGKSKDARNLQFGKPEFRTSFYSAINKLIEETSFELVSCLINKSHLMSKAAIEGINAEDPYIFSLQWVLDKIFFRCRDDLTCKIFPEKRADRENLQIELEMLRVKNAGTLRYKPKEISQKLEEFTLKDKKLNLSGLQLADLVVTPIGRDFIGKPERPGNEVSYKVVKSKMNTRDFTCLP
ncbi:MAG: DUF3800 domain-containing protein [Iphinoe sp. HA4291-MV1]|jgi:hypothetical protein|nr:DUF3800 domain-containing protein [Iphinoe sp. HA4291-MV1]